MTENFFFVAILILGAGAFFSTKQSWRTYCDQMLAIVVLGYLLHKSVPIALVVFFFMIIMNFSLGRASLRKRHIGFSLPEKTIGLRVGSAACGAVILPLLIYLSSTGPANSAKMDLRTDDIYNLVLALFLCGASMKGNGKWKK